MKKPTSYFHWIPRILAISGILFISMFALDSFSPDKSILSQIMDVSTHLLPSYILLIILIVSWKYELTGGILFVLTGLLLIPLVFTMNYHRTHSAWMAAGVNLIINIPFIIVGILFILSSRKTKKISRENINI